MPTGHDAFSKASSAGPEKQRNTAGVGNMVGGGILAAHGAASAPVFHMGRKEIGQMVHASPKEQAGRYQGELTQAMKDGKVPAQATLRLLKTPSGRVINAGGTHRAIARQALGIPHKKIEVKSLGYEPKEHLYGRINNRRTERTLKRGSKRAVQGKAKPVGATARKKNITLARQADVGDDLAWASHVKATPSQAEAVARMNKGGVIGAGLFAAGGLALAHHGYKEHKMMAVHKAAGHDAFLGSVVSKRDQNSSFGRTATGAVFPGIHAAIAGKKGHKLEAAAWELGGSTLGLQPGAAVGTHLASKRGHYKPLRTAQKVSKAAGTTEVSRTAKGKKVEVAYPPEVKAYIADKTAEVSKSHTMFLEDIEKFSAAGMVSRALPKIAGMGAKAEGAGRNLMAAGARGVKGPGAHGAMKAPGVMGTGKSMLGSGVARAGKFTRLNPGKVGGGAAIGGGGLASFGAGRAAKKNTNQY